MFDPQISYLFPPILHMLFNNCLYLLPWYIFFNVSQDAAVSTIHLVNTCGPRVKPIYITLGPDIKILKQPPVITKYIYTFIWMTYRHIADTWEPLILYLKNTSHLFLTNIVCIKRMVILYEAERRTVPIQCVVLSPFPHSN